MPSFGLESLYGLLPAIKSQNVIGSDNHTSIASALFFFVKSRQAEVDSPRISAFREVKILSTERVDLQDGSIARRNLNSPLYRPLP